MTLFEQQNPRIRTGTSDLINRKVIAELFIVAQALKCSIFQDQAIIVHDDVVEVLVNGDGTPSVLEILRIIVIEEIDFVAIIL